MATPKINSRMKRQIERSVQEYIERRSQYFDLSKRVENDLIEHAPLRKLIHSTKFREKKPSHLCDKLERKARDSLEAGKPFTIDKSNVFGEIDDLAGVRLLHIHTQQLVEIHPVIIEVLEFHKYTHRRIPTAYSWDTESEEFLKSLGFEIEEKPSLYTSVHYVVTPHFADAACEIQVRTLADELWGEVSHTVNYPHPTKSISCGEQLAALARFTSGCSRLVDSIYKSKTEYEILTAARERRRDA